MLRKFDELKQSVKTAGDRSTDRQAARFYIETHCCQRRKAAKQCQRFNSQGGTSDGCGEHQDHVGSGWSCQAGGCCNEGCCSDCWSDCDRCEACGCCEGCGASTCSSRNS